MSVIEEVAMMTDVMHFVIQAMRNLPLDKQEMVAHYVQELVVENGEYPGDAGLGDAVTPNTLWDKIDALVAAMPPEAFDILSTDGAEQHDHYLYGTPKQSSNETGLCRYSVLSSVSQST
jgi:hypothetical protein